MGARNYPIIPLETLKRAEHLLSTGERWDDVADLLNVGVFALRNQMNKNGMRTRYPRPRKRTKAELVALREQPHGKGWDDYAANNWLKVALR